MVSETDERCSNETDRFEGRRFVVIRDGEKVREGVMFPDGKSCTHLTNVSNCNIIVHPTREELRKSIEDDAEVRYLDTEGEVCSSCDGRGKVFITDVDGGGDVECSNCGGTGLSPTEVDR